MGIKKGDCSKSHPHAHKATMETEGLNYAKVEMRMNISTVIYPEQNPAQDLPGRVMRLCHSGSFCLFFLSLKGCLCTPVLDRRLARRVSQVNGNNGKLVTHLVSGLNRVDARCI